MIQSANSIQIENNNSNIQKYSEYLSLNSAVYAQKSYSQTKAMTVETQFNMSDFINKIRSTLKDVNGLEELNAKISQELEKYNTLRENFDELLITINSNMGAKISDSEGKEVLSKATEALNSKGISEKLFNYAIANSNNLDKYSIAKHQLTKDLSEIGIKADELTLEDGVFYTKNGKNALEIVKENYRNDDSFNSKNSLGKYEQISALFDVVASGGGFKTIDDIKVNYSYSKNFGLSLVSNLIYHA